MIGFEKTEKRLQELRQQGRQVITLAGGCFWCIESAFAEFDGVAATVSGYMGGTVPDPTYEQVCEGNTGHKEVVQVFYDENKVQLEAILERFFLNIDPTDSEGQFADKGPQYQTAVFYHTSEQKEAVQKYVRELEQSGRYNKPIATQILPKSEFYPAEDYHQQYYRTNAMYYQRYAEGSGRKGYVEKMKKATGLI